MLFDYETDLDNTKIETTNVMAKGTVKVCTRNWYEGEHKKIIRILEWNKNWNRFFFHFLGNKHVYPADKWESYEPEKKYEKYKKSGKLEENSRQIIDVKTKGMRCPNCGYGRGKLGEINYGTCYLCCEYKDGAV